MIKIYNDVLHRAAQDITLTILVENATTQMAATAGFIINTGNLKDLEH